MAWIAVILQATREEAMRRATVLIRIFSTALALLAAASGYAACNDEDFVTRVGGGDECFVVKAFGAAPGTPTLLVWLHGSVSAGGPADYMYQDAQRYASDSVASVALLLHGYADHDGNASTGDNHNRQGAMATSRNVDSLAAALVRLKEHYQPQRLVLLGHSTGALFAADILALSPGLADAVFLAGCPCEKPFNWRGVNPISLAEAVPLGAQVFAFTGSNDTVVPPRQVTGYIDVLKKRGVDARYIEIPGATHNWKSLFNNEIAEGGLQALLPQKMVEKGQ